MAGGMPLITHHALERMRFHNNRFHEKRRDYGSSGNEDDDGYGWDGIAIIRCAVGRDGQIGSDHGGWLNGDMGSKGRCDFVAARLAGRWDSCRMR